MKGNGKPKTGGGRMDDEPSCVTKNVTSEGGRWETGRRKTG